LPDAVLLDVVMPVMDGYTACTEIRRLPQASLTPILMITGLEDPESIDRAYQAGATEFTIKPVNWEIEIHRVRYLIRAEAVSRELRERERQLMHAQKLEAVGLLTSGIAHDFNNILTAIGGYAEIGAKDAGEQALLARTFLQIKEASDRAAGLTQQLLRFGKQQASEPVLLDLRAVVDEISGMLRHVLGRRIEISIVHEDGGAIVLADESHLEQVLMNLAVNARDAMPDGGELTITTSHVDLDEEDARGHPGGTPGAHVRLTVADTGCGMDEAIRERIFEPFFTTKGSTEGTGLGMSTVYGIVQKYGGHLQVESEPGRGSSFRIYLPAAR
jgi:signal transduction histidine kinase